LHKEQVRLTGKSAYKKVYYFYIVMATSTILFLIPAALFLGNGLKDTSIRDLIQLSVALFLSFIFMTFLGYITQLIVMQQREEIINLEIELEDLKASNNKDNNNNK
jgi:hypothetical protein